MEPIAEDQDLIVLEENLIRADTGKRFLNYIIDLLVFYALFFILGICIAFISPSVIENIDDSPGFNLADRLFSLLLYGVYMGVIEGLLKGKSVGKFITKTRAVNMDGSRISWEKALARGFSKAVPFCAFSALGSPCNPWQDRWTSTMVIDERELNKNI
ncbi:MAG: RDD family protein [Bacteroidota bacterium]